MQKEKKSFFRNLIKNFDKNDIEYVFLRGHEFLENKENYGEIDILIHSKNLKKLKEIFKQIPNSHVFKNNIDFTHPFLVRIIQEDFIVDLDFQIKGIGYCGSPVLKENYLFEHIKRKEEFNVLGDEARFLMLFVHGFIFKKKLDYFKKYEKEFLGLWEEMDEKKISERFNSLFNKKYSKKIIKLIKKRDLEMLFKLRGNLVRFHLTKNPFEILKIFISKIMRFKNYFHLDKFFYLINPFKWAPLICFIGADGSGKSTMVKESQNYLNSFGIKNISFSGGVFSGMKIIRDEKKIKSYPERISSQKRENNLKLFLRLILQIPKQIKIGFYRKRGFVVVTDRYLYDLVFFYKAKGFFRKLTKILSQKPSACFYVKVDPKKILKRNDELNLEAINSINGRINENKKYFSLKELKNNNLRNSKKELYKHLNKIMKNV
jgi:thymidylate kinase